MDNLEIRNAWLELDRVAPQLSPRDREFGSSLLAGYRKRGWSQKQAEWAIKLADRVNNPPPPPEKLVESLEPVVAIFDKARQHLKWPSFRILVEDGVEVRLALAGERSRYTGELMISGDGAWGERPYYGRIDLEGHFHPGRDAGGVDIKAALVRFAADPAGEAARFGKLCGRCCFCNTAIDDPRSTAVGYGPVCAKHYGLPWKAPMLCEAA